MLRTTARSHITGTTLLGHAASNGQVGAVQMLLDHGASLETCGDATDRTSTFTLALRAGRLSTVKVLLDAGASLLTKDHNSWTAFDHAVAWVSSREDHPSGDNLDLLRYIIDAQRQGDKTEANVEDNSNIEDNSDVDLMWLGMTEEQVSRLLIPNNFLVDRDVLGVLLDAGIPVDTRLPRNTTALRAVSGATGPICFKPPKCRESATAEVVSLLLDAGADINFLGHGGEGWPRCQSQTTPLIRAVQACYKGVVALLLSKGADVSLQDESTVSLWAELPTWSMASLQTCRTLC